MENYGFTWKTSGDLVSARTLRDEFAKAALIGMLDGTFFEPFLFDQIANRAYQMADAMMEARGK